LEKILGTVSADVLDAVEELDVDHLASNLGSLEDSNLQSMTIYQRWCTCSRIYLS
jgi:hypothetical protein